MSSEETEKSENEWKKQFYNRIYLSEVISECRYALLSMAYLRFAVSTRNNDLIFFSSHSFLNHVGNVSKFFWPDRETRRRWPDKSYQRDKELKGLLGVPENSPLRDKEFRNHYEHYDSRIDDWVFSSSRHNIINRLVGPLNQIKGVDRGDIMKHFDPQTFTLTFRGDIYDLRSAEQEIIKLLNNVRNLPPEVMMFIPDLKDIL